MPENAASRFQSKISLCLKHDKTTSLTEGWLLCVPWRNYHGSGADMVACAAECCSSAAGTASQHLLPEEQAEALTPTLHSTEPELRSTRHCNETPDHHVNLGCSQITLKLFNLHSCHQGRFCLPLHLQLHIPVSSPALSRW